MKNESLWEHSIFKILNILTIDNFKIITSKELAEGVKQTLFFLLDMYIATSEVGSKFNLRYKYTPLQRGVKN